MKKGEKAYRKLKKQGLSDKEIAESYVLPSDLTKKEKKEADKEFSGFLKVYREMKNGKYCQYNYLQSSINWLKKYEVSLDIPYRYLCEDHRFYHNWDHIEDLLEQIDKKGLENNEILFLATIFHDIVYDPKFTDNEEKSAELFMKSCKADRKLKQAVKRIILDTKTHKPSNEISKIFCEMDMAILKRPLDKLIEYENKIFKEFQCYDWLLYKKGRIGVLRQLQEGKELEPLISYIESRQPKIAIYAGSFQPFHRGHANILEKAEQIFDKVIIARGKNPDKNLDVYPLPDSIKFRQIELYDGLLTDFIKGLGYDVTVIRGLRNATDLQYELTQYRFLQDLDKNIKVISIFCDKDYDHVSSSAIRQLIKLNKPNSNYKLENQYLP